jgi:3-oxoacyl-[acyl-carrier-protein] synthase II
MTTQTARDVLITGIGLVSSLGEGVDRHWTALDVPGGVRPEVDRERFAPYPVHPIVPLDFDRQIPRRGDQRQMEAWQRIGTYAAGMALEDAGIKDDEDMLKHTDMIVAAGGGERDVDVDSAILSELLQSNDPGRVLNERLSNDLRPTLFLAQLPNLLAGNISIVHKVTGSSRTFMGEEAAGIDAVRTAHARVASGQSEICLVGGSYNAERIDLMLLFEFGGYMWHDDWRPVWERIAKGGGMITGSMGAFLILESPEHAALRGKPGLARLDRVLSDRCRREPGQAEACARSQFATLRPDFEASPLAVLSGATGAEPATSEEHGFLSSLMAADEAVAVRAIASAIGHGFEAQFPAQIALAALILQHGKLYPPRDDTGFEAPGPDRIGQVLVTLWGHWRGEGMALVKPVS